MRGENRDHARIRKDGSVSSRGSMTGESRDSCCCYLVAVLLLSSHQDFHFVKSVVTSCSPEKGHTLHTRNTK